MDAVDEDKDQPTNTAIQHKRLGRWRGYLQEQTGGGNSGSRVASLSMSFVSGGSWFCKPSPWEVGRTSGSHQCWGVETMEEVQCVYVE